MEALCGVSTWEEHTGERKWEVLGRRGHSEAIFALAVPAWHRTVHRTVTYRLDGKLRSPKYAKTPNLRKDGPYLPNRTVPSDRTSTSLVTMLQCRIWGRGTGNAGEWKALTQGTKGNKTKYVAPYPLLVSA